MNNHVNITANINSILKASMGIISEKINMAKEFLVDIEKEFVKNEKSEKCTFLINMISNKYIGKELKMDKETTRYVK